MKRSQNIMTMIAVLKKNNSRCLIKYLDKAMRALVLIMPIMSRHVKIFKVQDKNNKLMSFRIDNEKLFGLRSKILKIWIKCFTNLW